MESWKDCSRDIWNVLRRQVGHDLFNREQLGNDTYHSDIEGFKGDPIDHAYKEALDIIFYLSKSRALLCEAIDVIEELHTLDEVATQEKSQVKDRAWKFLEDVKPRLYPKE